VARRAHLAHARFLLGDWPEQLGALHPRPGIRVFFIGHGVVVIAAVYDLLARGYRPTWRDFGLACGWTTLWLAVVFPLNALFGWNYGYVGQTLAGTVNPIHVLGPWPWRVGVLAVGVIGLFAIMTLLPRLLPAHRDMKRDPRRA
jgi:hypothetical integral membrane protein (TIGR02206 family)